MLDDSKFTTGPKKKICWSSWNASVDDFLESEKLAIDAIQEEMEEMGAEMPLFPMVTAESLPRVLHTPLGMYHQDSMFKPSDRWDCWIGTTNFSITHGIKETLGMVEGIEALRVLGRYTFFIGIASLFDFKDVRIDVEKTLLSLRLNDGFKVNSDVFERLPRGLWGRLIRQALRLVRGDLLRIERVHFEQIEEALATQDLHSAGCTFDRNDQGIDNVRIRNKPIKPRKVYAVATTSFAQGTIDPFRDAASTPTGRILTDVLHEYLAETKTLRAN